MLLSLEKCAIATGEKVKKQGPKAYTVVLSTVACSEVRPDGKNEALMIGRLSFFMKRK